MNGLEMYNIMHFYITTMHEIYIYGLKSMNLQQTKEMNQNWKKKKKDLPDWFFFFFFFFFTCNFILYNKCKI